jgi:hypothetical protein
MADALAVRRCLTQVQGDVGALRDSQAEGRVKAQNGYLANRRTALANKRAAGLKFLAAAIINWGYCPDRLPSDQERSRNLSYSRLRAWSDFSGQKMMQRSRVSVRGTQRMEPLPETPINPPWRRELDHLGPLLGFVGDQSANSTADPTSNVPPRSANRALILGLATPVLISRLSLS